ncbi:hypothetical protein K440DRAFT_123153 [Wilcoxina mikolae CBS 423.85]|nr:hypothetical protein K440DRAFT_123153 [Wilcoxina mikolae CBS 423.85]
MDACLPEPNRNSSHLPALFGLLLLLQLLTTVPWLSSGTTTHTIPHHDPVQNQQTSIQNFLNSSAKHLRWDATKSKCSLLDRWGEDI